MKQVTLHVKEDAFSEYWQQRKFDVNDKEGNHITTVATKNDGETLFEIEDLHPNLTTFLAGFVGYQDKSERIKLLNGSVRSNNVRRKLLNQAAFEHPLASAGFIQLYQAYAAAANIQPENRLRFFSKKVIQ